METDSANSSENSTSDNESTDSGSQAENKNASGNNQAQDLSKLSLSEKARLLSGLDNETGEKNGEPEKKEPVAQNKKKFKLKVDGEEFEQEFDLSNEDELRTHFQLSHAAKKRMAEANQQKKEVAQLINQLRDDPFSILRDKRILGEDKLMALAENMLAEKIRLSSMTDQEKRLHEADQIIKQNQYRQEQEKAAVEAQRKEAEINNWRNHYEKMIVTSLDHIDKSLRTPETVSRMAKYIEENERDGLGLTPLEIAQFIKKEKEQEEQKFETLYLARQEEKRKKDVANLKSNPKFGSSNNQSSKSPNKSSDFVDPLSWAENIRMTRK